MCVCDVVWEIRGDTEKVCEKKMKRTAAEVGLVIAVQQQNGSGFEGWNGQEGSVAVMGEGCDSSSSPQKMVESRRVRARTATSTETACEISGGAVGHVPLPAQRLINNGGGVTDAMREAFLQHASSVSKTHLEGMIGTGAGADANSVQHQQHQLQQMQQRLPARSASCPDFLRVFEQQQRAAEMDRRREREQQMYHGSIH